MKKTILISLVALVLFSCKKDDKDEACTISTAAIAGSYKITVFTYKLNSTAPEQNLFTDNFTNACERDNIHTFQTNGTYQLRDAGIVCSPAVDETGTWSLSGNNLELDGDPALIESFDCKTLVVSVKDQEITGDEYKITFTRQ